MVKNLKEKNEKIRNYIKKTEIEIKENLFEDYEFYAEDNI